MDVPADGDFREFMLGRWPGLVRLAYGLTGDQALAEDLAQTSLARAYAS
jgi:DNA-directed RNA polymerase specialized sigma24 family protein